MILNGIDLVYIPRIEKLKDNENFIKKIFTADEIKYIKNPSIFILSWKDSLFTQIYLQTR